MYRAVALLALREQIPLDDAEALATVARGHEISFGTDGDLYLDGVRAGAAIRTPQVASAVVPIAAHPPVRQVVVALQRDLLQDGTWVADGRDIGTVVAPDAPLKVFLTADAHVRAERRHAELTAAGHHVSVHDVLTEIVGRDTADSQRATSPLAVADDAHVVDTGGLSVDQVTDRLVQLVRENLEGVG